VKLVYLISLGRNSNEFNELKAGKQLKTTKRDKQIIKQSKI